MKITKTYEPNNYEPEIYNLWELSGAFESSGVGPKYSHWPRINGRRRGYFGALSQNERL